MSSSFVCESPRRLWTNTITVGTPARETSAASWSGPDGRRCEVPETSRIASSASSISVLVEEDRLDRPDPLPGDVDVLLGGEALGRRPAPTAAARELAGVEVALVEQLLRGLDDRGDDPRLADDAARGADRAVADLARDRRGSRARASPRRRARRGACPSASSPACAAWPRQRDPRALDAERAEDDAERQVERLEHGALLDVQLEVGARALELPPRLERAVEVDAVLAQRVRQRDRRRASRSCAQLVLVAHRAGGRRRAEERAAEARALLVGPVDEPDRQRRRALLGDPPQHLDAGDDVEAAVEPAAVRHRVDVAADQQRALATRPAA